MTCLKNLARLRPLFWRLSMQSPQSHTATLETPLAELSHELARLVERAKGRVALLIQRGDNRLFVPIRAG